LLLDGSAEDPRAGLPADLHARPDRVEQGRSGISRATGLSISLKTGDGLAHLIEAADRQKVRARLEGSSDAPALTRSRHRHALTQALAHLKHGWTRPPISPNCWRKICAWPCAPSAASPDVSMWRAAGFRLP
jgi:hypothetical protein